MRRGLLLSVSLSLGVIVCFLSSIGCTGSKKDGSYEKAERFWDRKMYGLAAQNYEQFACQQPKHPKAAQGLYKAGFIYAYYLADYPRAIQLFHRLIALYPQSPYCLQARQNLAENYETHLRQYPLAIAQYARLIELEEKAGGDVSPYSYKIGRCYFLMGDSKQAQEIYEKICRETPTGQYADSAAYQIGFIDFLEGDWEAAESNFRFLLERYPESPWTFDGMVHLARCLKMQDREEESKRVYRQIREQFPERSAEIEDNKTQEAKR